MLIAIPTGVKIFNWLFTEYRGRVHFTTPMLWFLGFVLNFSVGGMTGVLLSSPPIDYQVHNSLFLIAHFHGVLIGGMLFGFFTGFTYWFPKIAGFKLNERLGRYAFWCWFVGFQVAFMPLYMLGFMGATRRLDHYEIETDWHPLLIVAAIGAIIIAAGIGFQLLMLYVSFKHRKENADLTGDPWNGRTLEWSTPSPPPHYNFAIIPRVESRDPFWASKQGSKPHAVQPQKYRDIWIPKYSSIPFCIGVCSFFIAFGLTWHMFWLAIIGICGVFALLIFRLTRADITTHERLSGEEIKKIEEKNLNKRLA
jgi:cytochrome o ubiquinol oxidase subunit 1